MGRMSYDEACDAGYDGPSPFEERRRAAMKRRNDMLDPRDPDYIDMDEEDEESGDVEACPNCGQAYNDKGNVMHDIGRCVSCGEEDEYED